MNLENVYVALPCGADEYEEKRTWFDDEPCARAREAGIGLTIEAKGEIGDWVKADLHPEVPWGFHLPNDWATLYSNLSRSERLDRKEELLIAFGALSPLPEYLVIHGKRYDGQQTILAERAEGVSLSRFSCPVEPSQMLIDIEAYTALIKQLNEREVPAIPENCQILGWDEGFRQLFFCLENPVTMETLKLIQGEAGCDVVLDREHYLACQELSIPDLGFSGDKLWDVHGMWILQGQIPHISRHTLAEAIETLRPTVFHVSHIPQDDSGRSIWWSQDGKRIEKHRPMLDPCGSGLWGDIEMFLGHRHDDRPVFISPEVDTEQRESLCNLCITLTCFAFE